MLNRRRQPHVLHILPSGTISIDGQTRRKRYQHSDILGGHYLSSCVFDPLGSRAWLSDVSAIWPDQFHPLTEEIQSSTEQLVRAKSFSQRFSPSRRTSQANTRRLRPVDQIIEHGCPKDAFPLESSYRQSLPISIAALVRPHFEKRKRVSKRGHVLFQVIHSQQVRARSCRQQERCVIERRRQVFRPILGCGDTDIGPSRIESVKGYWGIAG